VFGCLAVNKSTNISGKYTTGYCKNKTKAVTLIIIIIIIFDEKYGKMLQRKKIAELAQRNRMSKYSTH
jgi:hypothetical protein